VIADLVGQSTPGKILKYFVGSEQKACESNGEDKMSPTTIKSEDKRKRTVFRQILDTPFNLTWYGYSSANSDTRKSVDQGTSQDILDVLCRFIPFPF